MKLFYCYIVKINCDVRVACRGQRAMRALVLALTTLVVQHSASGATGSSGDQPDAFGSRMLPVAGTPIVERAPTWYLLAMRPERDIEAIILDTFNEAARSGSAGALIKFISRHPDHPLADKARRMLEEGNYPPARKTPSEWVDSKIVEFDAARRAGPDALKTFIAKHPGHPLAAEARRLLSE